MTHEQATFYIEVDIALRYPPSPQNTITTHHIIATDRGQLQAELTAIGLATRTQPCIMATAVRVVLIEI